MPKASAATQQLPAAVLKALRDLGNHLETARKRRQESLRAWATRMNVSVPTLMRMEKGDPAVGMGVYATSLWLAGQHHGLAELAAPARDLEALEMELSRRSRVRAATPRKGEAL